MTDTIARLRALHKAATPGDWFVDLCEQRGCLVLASNGIDHDWVASLDGLPGRNANAAFIAAARNALPALLDVAEAARVLARDELAPIVVVDRQLKALQGALEALGKLELP